MAFSAKRSRNLAFRARRSLSPVKWLRLWTQASNSATTPSTNERDFGFVNQRGLSRKQIFDAIEASLKNLGVDYLDLFQIHRFDNHTPVEETVETLHNLVKLGKCYVQQYDKELIHANLVTGASSMWAWQFSKMNHVAETREWTKFVSQQNHYNLLYREEEREMNPYCLDAGCVLWFSFCVIKFKHKQKTTHANIIIHLHLSLSIGLIPWSPLAGGKLTGKKRDTERAKMIGNIEGGRTDRESCDWSCLALVQAGNHRPDCRHYQGEVPWGCRALARGKVDAGRGQIFRRFV
ncbi:NADP-dependent oxidoreductase domain-containing protein [Jimgerdemannia flammicorona]|uniref:NADP-dependent oxidoreductase domain-containing protein n=1 Tax=Jimgerdemannia flammicorona TaxID=994334 RepID=A0A433CXT7_9FUNG|nr:NADP-dependent oxidoreductase domain-containing protein [Jimgerdemannia flammicorona]